MRYGGDTSSVALSAGNRAPTLVLDAGTGLHRLGSLLGDEPFAGSILLTHLHWDHTHGLPFTPAIDRRDARVDVLIPAQKTDPSTALARAIGPPHFPITVEDLGGVRSVGELVEGGYEIGDFTVEAREVPHKGGRTFGYRLTLGQASLAYIPDHSPGPGSEPVAELAKGVDLLIHDSQHLESEWSDKAYLGHASVEYAVDLAIRCGVGRLLLFHHDPARTDPELDEIARQVSSVAVPVRVASAGLTLSIGASQRK